MNGVCVCVYTSVQLSARLIEGNVAELCQLPDDGGHDVIDNFEFLCNSMENLISI